MGNYVNGIAVKAHAEPVYPPTEPETWRCMTWPTQELSVTADTEEQAHAEFIEQYNAVFGTSWTPEQFRITSVIYVTAEYHYPAPEGGWECAANTGTEIIRVTAPTAEEVCAAFVELWNTERVTVYPPENFDFQQNYWAA